VVALVAVLRRVIYFFYLAILWGGVADFSHQ